MKLFFCIFLMIASVFIASFAQILLKKGASKTNIYINAFTIIGYVLMCISILCSYLGYYEVEFGLSGVLQALSFIFVPLFSYFLLKEKITKKMVVGIVLIILGTVIYCL